ncbi:MAG: trypsin-like peptidase domain-containing protein, partial [Acidobacteriaceae bacterium]
DIPAIAKAANGAIVSIVMSDKDGSPIAQGSGFLVSKDGVVVTNYHVISEGSSAIVKFPDGAFYVVDGVLTFDKTRDVAVIKAHGENFRTLTLGNSDRLQVGEEVVAIGNPLSLESTVSNGIVSGIRTVEEAGGKLLQVTTPISPGSSGGPLFNMSGEVIGITSSGLQGGENLNFAIQINDAKHLLLVKAAKIQSLPDEPERVKAQTHDTDAPTAPVRPTAARSYYKQLYDAGGFSDAGYVCFDMNADSDRFFTFRASGYDKRYAEAIEVLNTAQTNEVWQEAWNTMKSIRQATPYLYLLDEAGFDGLSPEAQSFYRHGGRELNEVYYGKIVRTGDAKYNWDGTSWVAQDSFVVHDSPDPNARVRKTRMFRLYIDPTTLKYAEFVTITSSTGSGESTGTSSAPVEKELGKGTCEKISDRQSN